MALSSLTRRTSTRSRRPLASLALLLILPACAHGQVASAAAPQRADTAALRRTLDSLANAHRGVVGYAVRNIDTGERLERRGDETFPTASLIKVAILVTLFDLIEQKKIALDDPLTVLAIDQVPGSGVLQFFKPGAILTVGDAAWLMMGLSDNTATNLILDRIIIRRVWEKMEKLGLDNTKVHSKSFLRIASVAMDSSVKYGFGVTTPAEMATLFELIGQGKAVSPAADSMMLRMLETGDNPALLLRYAPRTRAAHKWGGTDLVRTDCALFFRQTRVVACVLTKENEDRSWRVDNEAQVTIARMGEAVVGAWPARPGS
jgi:beta-lactamase class A